MTIKTTTPTSPVLAALRLWVLFMMCSFTAAVGPVPTDFYICGGAQNTNIFGPTALAGAAARWRSSGRGWALGLPWKGSRCCPSSTVL